MCSLKLLTCQLGSGNTTCNDTTNANVKMWSLIFYFFFNRAPFNYSCIQMYNILAIYQFNTTVFPLISGLVFTSWLWCLETGTRLWDKHLWLHLRGAWVLCKLSHLTEDDRKIYVNAGMVELHNTLKIWKRSSILVEESFFTHLRPAKQTKIWSPLSPVE